MRRRQLSTIAVIALAASSTAVPAFAQTAHKLSIEQVDAMTEKLKNDPNTSPQLKEVLSLPYVKGPNDVPITDRAHIQLGNDQEYLDSQSADRFFQLSGNLPNDVQKYIVLPRDQSWWSVYSFQDTGYVKDNEHLDPDALLGKLKENQAAANEQRRGKGLNTLTLDGWQVPPHYDPETKRLEWGIALHDDQTGEKVINYTTRLLGREGVMAATLITSPSNFDEALPEFRRSLTGFAYNPEHSYSAFKQGDKVAEYGLAALIAGGVTAAAIKSGAGKGLLAGAILLFKGFFKFIFVGIAALFAGALSKIKSLFGRKSS